MQCGAVPSRAPPRAPCRAMPHAVRCRPLLVPLRFVPNRTMDSGVSARLRSRVCRIWHDFRGLTKYNTLSIYNVLYRKLTIRHFSAERAQNYYVMHSTIVKPRKSCQISDIREHGSLHGRPPMIRNLRYRAYGTVLARSFPLKKRPLRLPCGSTAFPHRLAKAQRPVWPPRDADANPTGHPCDADADPADGPARDARLRGCCLRVDNPAASARPQGAAFGRLPRHRRIAGRTRLSGCPRTACDSRAVGAAFSLVADLFWVTLGAVLFLYFQVALFV